MNKILQNKIIINLLSERNLQILDFIYMDSRFKVYNLIANSIIPLDKHDIAIKTNLNDRKIVAIINSLRKQGLINMKYNNNLKIYSLNPNISYYD